ncbi:protein kinase [Singulisphaera sp. Ch08]|uniref:Protein kinase n=1 Tax=Singulisphaera sp. Ch08 TaxID=3120278 RepID=A0AAU7CBB3_9BACT
MTASTSIHPECPRCGAKVATDAPEGLCIRCLANLNLTADSVLTGAEASRSEPPSLEEIATHFPQLEVLACLGRGGMGVVYKARQKSLDRVVALKILAPEREQDPQFAERFAREAQALAKLSHPHIVTVYDFGQADGLFYLLMEYVDGVNLRQLLRTRRLEPKEALAIVPPICDALQYAHDHAVVHRDIKPENLLLDKAGQVKIADFGIAKMLGGDSTPDEEQRVGTPHYMAPEQHATPQAADHRADIYSLGVVLYEMLTGELPAGQFELPSRKVRIDVRLDEIVLRALDSEPELRFQQAEQMKTAVETLTRVGQEIGPDTSPSVSRANRSKSPESLNSFTFIISASIAITLAVLFLAANLGILSQFRGRVSGDSPNTRNSNFTEEAQRGLDAFERADYDQAIVAFDELIRLDPNHSEAHRWRGDASLNKFEFGKALSEYDEAIRLDPKNGMAYCGRGAVSTVKGEFDKAIASFDEAIRLDPQIANMPFYKRYRAAAKSLPPNPENPTFAEEAQRGLDAFERADYDQAIVVFDELIRLDPNHSEAHRWRGDALLNKHKIDNALSEYDEAIRLDPNNGMAYCSRGAALTEKWEFDKAIASFDEAIRLDPQIANMPFYKRYRAAAEFPWSLGLLVVVPLLAFGLCLFLAFAAWSILRHRKPKPDKDL